MLRNNFVLESHVLHPKSRAQIQLWNIHYGKECWGMKWLFYMYRLSILHNGECVEILVLG